MVSAICRPAFQHETPVTIAAIDIAMLVNLQIDARVAQRSGPIVRAAADGARAVAANALGLDCDHFRRCNAHDQTR